MKILTRFIGMLCCSPAKAVRTLHLVIKKGNLVYGPRAIYTIFL